MLLLIAYRECCGFLYTYFDVSTWHTKLIYTIYNIYIYVCMYLYVFMYICHKIRYVGTIIYTIYNVGIIIYTIYTLYINKYVYKIYLY